MLSYVYDSGVPQVDTRAADAARMLQPVNGLDPTTFPSVALMEGDLVAFGRTMLHGRSATESITFGGTESCLLAVKAARDVWRCRHPCADQRPTLVLATSACGLSQGRAIPRPGPRGGPGEIDLTSVLHLIETVPREGSARMLTDFLAEFTAPRRP